jgi:putative oxidoreductase
MKKLFNVQHSNNTVDAGILLLRVGIAALMLTHGLPKLATLFSGDPIQFASVMGMSPSLSLALAVFAEVLCSILILIGFGTRLATIPLIITMLVAVFMIHAGDPFAKQEMGLHYLLVYLFLLIRGSGKYSVDNLVQGQRQSASLAAA